MKGLDRKGKEVRIKAENNLLAEALEHEIDHINGVLYIDHLESMDELVKLDDEDGNQRRSNGGAGEDAPTLASGRREGEKVR